MINLGRVSEETKGISYTQRLEPAVFPEKEAG